MATFEITPWVAYETAVSQLDSPKLPEEPSTLGSIVLAKRALNGLSATDDIKEKASLQLEANQHLNAARRQARNPSMCTELRLQTFTLDTSIQSNLRRDGKEYPNGIRHFHNAAAALSANGMTKEAAFKHLIDAYWINQKAVFLLDGASFTQALEDRDLVLPTAATIPTMAAAAPAGKAFSFHAPVHGSNFGSIGHKHVHHNAVAT
jgi:hypothetical protein